MRPTRKHAWPVCFALSLSAGVAGAQAPESQYRLFADDAPLELALTGPLGDVFNDTRDRDEFPVVIEWTEPDGRRLTQEIELRIRGNSRIGFCNYPPLSLDFPRSDMSGTIFAGQNRLKLVVLCKNASYYHDYLAEEFLIYRMFNQLTERSFRVRWATIDYVDTSRRRTRLRTAPAFFIEGDAEAAERLGMEAIDIERVALDSLEPRHAAMLMVFNYLIGNTDWAVILGSEGEFCCHNGKVLRGPGGEIVVLPYDFDNSGLIDAEYAVPSPILPIRTVRQRLYRGYCVFNAELAGAIALINERREQMLGLFDSDLIGERGRREAVEYLEESFGIINDPEELQEEIYAECL